KISILAKAEADKISRLNEAIKDNPAYIQLQAMEALKEISKDESSKIYFIDGSSPSPLPLMHMGDTKKN
ncbi:MAG: prohibitin family protein, partial [Fibrobacterota bacterium]